MMDLGSLIYLVLIFITGWGVGAYLYGKFVLRPAVNEMQELIEASIDSHRVDRIRGQWPLEPSPSQRAQRDEHRKSQG